jgi:hypothetical protein
LQKRPDFDQERTPWSTYLKKGKERRKDGNKQRTASPLQLKVDLRHPQVLQGITSLKIGGVRVIFWLRNEWGVRIENVLPVDVAEHVQISQRRAVGTFLRIGSK